jgi:hypothetical protein
MMIGAGATMEEFVAESHARIRFAIAPDAAL